jgi:hypothetical protein
MAQTPRLINNLIGPMLEYRTLLRKALNKLDKASKEISKRYDLKESSNFWMKRTNSKVRNSRMSIDLIKNASS